MIIPHAPRGLNHQHECSSGEIKKSVGDEPEGPPGLIRFWEAILAIDRPPKESLASGYSGLSISTGVSIQRAHGYAHDLEDQGFLLIITGVASQDPSERRPGRFYLTGKGQRAKAAATAPDGKVVADYQYTSPPLLRGRGDSPTREEILSRLAQFIDPLEERWEGLPTAAYLMARASVRRGHPEVKPGEWAQWAGVSRRTGTRVVAAMVTHGLAKQEGYGKYRCTVKVYVLGSDWDALIELVANIREFDMAKEYLAIADLMEDVANKSTPRGHALVLAAHRNRNQGRPKPEPVAAKPTQELEPDHVCNASASL